MILDSDVLIWFFRGNENAKKIVRVNIPFSISAVSYMELLQGALNKQELLGIKKFLEKAETKIIPMNEGITHRAMEYVESYALSDSMVLNPRSHIQYEYIFPHFQIALHCSLSVHSKVLYHKYLLYLQEKSNSY